MKIVFMGSADFGIPALEKLSKNHTIAGVVSTPAKPKGRGLKLIESPVTLYAQEHKIEPILRPENLKAEQFRDELIALKADLFVVVAFKILPKNIFSIPPLGTVNIHASLLPKYRGPAPIHRAIEAGERETGITIFRIDEGIDTGEILLQQSLSVGDLETTPELYERLSSAGAEMLINAIHMLERGTVQPVLQEHTQSTKAPKLSKEEGRINWGDSAERIFNKIRAFKPFPGTFCILDSKRLGIDWALPFDSTATALPGTVLSVSSEFLEVQCNPGRLRILRVKPEGRNEMDVHDFLLGKKIVEGVVFK